MPDPARSAAARLDVSPARLAWNGDQPSSRQYGDIYHAPDGSAEVQRVFIEPQCLAQRFAATSACFTVGELGFGTGLNFAVVAQRFIEYAPPATRLHFISVEKHPLRSADFARTAARRCPQLPIYAELERQYPPLLGGWHRRHLCGGRISLSLYFGEAETGLRDIVDRQRAAVDAWLLDGFAPDRNPDLWTPALWQAIAALSALGTTLATFSAVGHVRRALADAGFEMRRIDQRPHKRHSLAGVFAHRPTRSHERARSAVIVGAGIAGAATASQLAQRGVQVTVLDRAAGPPDRIDGAVLHCRLAPEVNAAAPLRCRSFLYSSLWYDRHDASSTATGLLQFANASMTPQRLETAASTFAHTGNWLIPVDPSSASALTGRPVRSGGLYFPRGRALDLGALCAELLHHPLIDYRPGVAASSLQTDAQRARVSAGSDIFDADQIILCNAAAANDFDQARYLELVPVWGQIDRIRLDDPPAMPLLGDGFVTPLTSGWGIGATYEHHGWTVAQASAFNLRRFSDWWHRLTGSSAVASVGAPMRGSRAVASDRKPIIGAVYDANLAQVPRLLLNTGHGSQGTVSAPFAAECIASELSGEFAPMSQAELASVSSLRFRQRQARRGPRHGARL